MQQKERVVGVHRLAGKVGVEREVVNKVVPPDVTVALHVDIFNPGVLDHHHMRHGRAFFKDGVKVGLEGLELAATHGRVGRDDHARLAALDAAAHAALGIAGKNGRVYGPDAGTGQHGNKQLRDHRHIQGHVIAFADAQRAQCMSHPADLCIEHLVGIAANVRFFFALPDEGCLVAPA